MASSETTVATVTGWLGRMVTDSSVNAPKVVTDEKQGVILLRMIDGTNFLLKICEAKTV